MSRRSSVITTNAAASRSHAAPRNSAATSSIASAYQRIATSSAMLTAIFKAVLMAPSASFPAIAACSLPHGLFRRALPRDAHRRRHERIEDGERTASGLLPAEAPHRLEARAAHRRSNLRRALELEHGPGDAFDIERIDEPDRRAADLGASPGRRRNDGAAARHRFDDRKAEALVQRRQHEELRELIEQRDALVRHESGKDDVLELPVSETAGSQVRVDPLARDDEREAAAPLPVETVAAQQTLVVAAGILRHPPVPRVIAARDGQYETLGQPVRLAETSDRFLVALWRETRSRCRIGDHGLRAVELQIPREIVDHRLRDREHLLRLTQVEGHRHSDVDVVPPWIILRIHVPVRALQHERRGPRPDERKRELRVEDQIRAVAPCDERDDELIPHGLRRGHD